MTTPMIPILKVQVRSEQDVVTARQRARQIASLLQFENQDQNRLATAVSELARNAFSYAQGGEVEFLFSEKSAPQALFIRISDKGPGIQNMTQISSGEYVSPHGMGIGLMGSKKLMDSFHLETSAGGTTILIGKNLRRGSKAIGLKDISKLCAQLAHMTTQSPYQEIQRQNRDLLETLDELNDRQSQLSQLNKELSETNSGVVALYTELDEKASSLLKANKVKTSFLSNMTHEFRTPLSSIISMTGILLDRLDGELTPEQEKQTRYIRKSAEGLLELVNDLLDLAKVEAGKISINKSEFEVNSLLGAQRGVFKPLLANNPRLDFVIQAERIEPMNTDEAKVSQILRNLISNAIKYTDQGRITLTARADENDGVLFTVADTGLGIAEENLEFIFEDFSQIDSSHQQKSKGTGLGLPLSRKLARLLGGELWATSEPGKGSVFYARIPRLYEGDAEGQFVPDQEAAGKAPLRKNLNLGGQGLTEILQ
jgi:signal transduction histidine kinase